MKNVKLIGATAFIVLASTVASIMAPSVMAQVEISEGLKKIDTLSKTQMEVFQKSLWSDLKTSLLEAKKAKDIRKISKKEYYKIFKNDTGVGRIAMNSTISIGTRPDAIQYGKTTNYIENKEINSTGSKTDVWSFGNATSYNKNGKIITSADTKGDTTKFGDINSSLVSKDKTPVVSNEKDASEFKPVGNAAKNEQVSSAGNKGDVWSFGITTNYEKNAKITNWEVAQDSFSFGNSSYVLSTDSNMIQWDLEISSYLKYTDSNGYTVVLGLNANNIPVLKSVNVTL